MQKLREVVITSVARTAIGSFGGSLKDIPAVQLAAIVMKEVVKRSNIDPAQIGDVRFGCCLEHEDAANVGRIGALMAGIPNTVTGVTVNRVCVSAMEAIHSGCHQIQTGYSDIVLAGGVESMSNCAYVVPNARWGLRMGDGELVDTLMHGLHIGSAFYPYPMDGPVENMRGKPYIMGMTAEFLAMKNKISREDQDIVALRSHNNVERCVKEGLSKEEIVPVPVKGKKGIVLVEKDEHFKPGLTMEQLSKLTPAFIPKVGTVTAGNASGLNDGAAAVIIMAREVADRLGIKPLAYITGFGRGGCAPEYMGESPIPAVKDMLKTTGRKLSEYERIEVNEAFASQYLSVERGLGLDRSITNLRGSGIGIGHPIGCTGARIIISLMSELKASKKKLGFATLCGGGGVSLATEITMA